MVHAYAAMLVETFPLSPCTQAMEPSILNWALPDMLAGATTTASVIAEAWTRVECETRGTQRPKNRRPTSRPSAGRSTSM